jgi:hypothetical protein
MRDTILAIIAKTPNPKSWAIKIKNNTSIMKIITPIMDQFNITIAAAVYCYLNNVTPICENCNTKKFTWFNKGFAYCGKRNKCKCHFNDAPNKSKLTNIFRYGVPSYAQTTEYIKKTKTTNFKKFGVEQASWSSIIRNKARQTCLIKYGTEYPIKLAVFQEKLKSTKLKNHSNTNFNNRAKYIKTVQKKYGVKNSSYINKTKEQLQILLNKETFIKFITGKTIQYAAGELHVDPNTINKYTEIYDCKKLLIDSTYSKWELIISEYLKKLNVQVICNSKKIIPPYELDFYLPDFNVAIELNGNYWHSESMGKGPDYHFLKWKMCKERGINLFQYFEDELIQSIDLIKAKIRYIIHAPVNVIGARKIIILPISYNEESTFLETYHIQGSSKARNESVGAFYDNKLVGVISWLTRTSYLEITRFATDTSASYPGLFSKLLTYIIRKLNYHGRIISFSDNRHSTGNLYKAAGFTNVAILKAAYWYTKDYILRENRQNYMKTKIAKKFNIDVKNNTEAELMVSLGYDRIWDAGKIKWQLII